VEEPTLNVARMTLVTFSLTADLATLVKRAITSYFLHVSLNSDTIARWNSLVESLGGNGLER
jgi:hypothetical protein